LATLLSVEQPSGLDLDLLQLLALTSSLLAGVQRKFVLLLNLGLRLTLKGFEAIQGLGALQDLRVLLAAPSGASRCYPSVEAGFGGIEIGSGFIEFELGLRLGVSDAALGSDGAIDAAAKLLRSGAVEIVVEFEALLHFGQIAHHGATQADQKTGKHQSDHPKAALEPFFR
jgi:hypothetical protein